MKQGYSGSQLRLQGGLVEKNTTDEEFISNSKRQKDLLLLSRSLEVLPRIDRVNSQCIFMEFIYGEESLTEHNARRVGKALQQLHGQSGYQHLCMTGLDWLIDTASQNLANRESPNIDLASFLTGYPIDALIHSEPQFIERPDGSIVFVDVEGVGRGSRYQDLGHMYMWMLLDGHPELFKRILEGYQNLLDPVMPMKITKMAGLIALAYAAFADFDRRMRLGIELIGQSQS